MGTSLSAAGKAARPLRVGYLVQQFPPEVGAGAARVGEMAERWQDKGTTVTIFTGMPNRPEGRIHQAYRGRLFFKEEWHGITVRRSWLYASPKHGMGRTLLNNLSFMTTSGFDVARYAGRLDVLIASSPPFFPHISGTLIAATRRVPLILEVRDLWPDYLAEMGHLSNASARRMLFGLERKLLHRAEHVVTVTEALKRRLLEKGLPAEKITVIPNGVDPSLYYKSAEPAPLPDLRSDRSTYRRQLRRQWQGQHGPEGILRPLLLQLRRLVHEPQSRRRQLQDVPVQRFEWKPVVRRPAGARSAAVVVGRHLHDN